MKVAFEIILIVVVVSLAWLSQWLSCRAGFHAEREAN